MHNGRCYVAMLSQSSSSRSRTTSAVEYSNMPLSNQKLRLSPTARNNFRALKMIRNGADFESVCRKLKLETNHVLGLDELFKHVPNRVVSSIEHTLSDHIKLRRLLRTMTPDDAMTLD